MWKTIMIGFISLGLLTGCDRLLPSISEEAYLGAMMDESLLQYSNIDMPGREHLAILGEDGLELRLIPGQPLLHGGIRAQVGVNFPYMEDDSVRYQWQLRFPTDFQPDPQNRWWIIAEWHDQPDTSRGESWETFPSRSAIIMFTYAFIDGQPLLGFHYGPQQALIGTLPIRYGEWLTLTADIHWSQQANGWARIYAGSTDQSLFSANGPNMYNAVQHYFLVGLYRHRDITLDSRLQVRGLGIEYIERKDSNSLP